ncbi:hypothetical protein [Streptomyces sp. BK205]|uniref:hypothetical protein n=1 Tax=Streptomyces sp. BK205 TaxID=2512164 RepID=UPI0014045622|nr:hypothetical protein [Streptomyces sp. BK205]
MRLARPTVGQLAPESFSRGSEGDGDMPRSRPYSWTVMACSGQTSAAPLETD